MRKFLSSYEDNTKIFLGDTDSYTIVQNGYTENELMLKIKIAVLLYDVVFIPAAYMWQSEPMTEILYKLEPFMLTENVFPIIRKCKETRDVKDYFERRENETQKLKQMEVYKIPGLATEIADVNNRKDMEFLNGLNCCLHLEERSVKEEFIKLWKGDLVLRKDINSIDTILYQSNLDINQLKGILDRLKNGVDYEYFSRSTLIDYILKLRLPSFVEERLKNRISWLYLKANAEASDSEFYISKSFDNTLVYKGNLDLYVKTLESFGINSSMIRCLSMEDILRIKYSEEYRVFIVNYRQLVDNIYFQQTDLIERANRQIRSQMIKESFRKRLWKVLQQVYQFSGMIFIELILNYILEGNINKTALYASGGVNASSYILRKIEIVNKAMSNTSFIEFKEYIMKEKYKEKMQKSINGVIL